MSDPVELKKLVKQLQSATTEQEIVDILQTLKKEFQVNEAILRESKAGLAVGKLRTHAKKEVADAAKELVKKWKTEVERAKAGGTHAAKAAPARKASIVSGPSTPITPTAPNSGKPEVRTAKKDGVTMNHTGDTTRDKCMELVYDSLAVDSGSPPEQLLDRAKAIEKAVYTEHGSTNAAYKAKIRTLFVNLKDKNNPSLRGNVVSGELSVERFTKMTSQEMASEERKAADSKIREDNLFASLGAGEQQAETDAFQCGRCKQRKCRYRQAQTRSADEPMTTFVTCTVCNNRWKFS
ncbi:RNA polymerase II elongation factor [Pleurotus pulmonarius]|nr:RNA polymerase II elongation factor [Pleurotus pulmonarius]KAF4588277.1 RNA polymerase II elongation factor [Pleurotus pulmonarius]